MWFEYVYVATSGNHNYIHKVKQQLWLSEGVRCSTSAWPSQNKTSDTYAYCIVPGKRPWTIVTQAPNICCMEDVLEWFNYPHESAHFGCEVSCQGLPNRPAYCFNCTSSLNPGPDQMDQCQVNIGIPNHTHPGWLFSCKNPDAYTNVNIGIWVPIFTVNMGIPLWK